MTFFQFNFVGKLLGPRGNSLKRLQEETMCKMSILGRGSMKDKGKVSIAFESEDVIILLHFHALVHLKTYLCFATFKSP